MTRRSASWIVLAALPICFAACMLLGPSGLGLPDWGTASGRAVFFLRLYRVLAGFVIGAALSCAGVVLQALLRNPLAEPYVLGVSSGAGVGAAVAILTGIGAVTPFALPALAFIGGASTLALVYSLAGGGGKLSVYSLILSGVIVGAVFSSLLMFMVATAPVEGLHSVVWWMLGNLEVQSRALFAVSAIVMAGGMLAIRLMAPELNALCLGREMAHHVGVRTRVAVVLGLGLATLVTSTAVGLAGLIGFVGLIVPHAVRHLVGPDHRTLVPVSALAGGMFLALCDAVARTVIAPIEIPVGVVTAFVGGPFFLVVLRNRRRRGWIE